MLPAPVYAYCVCAQAPLGGLRQGPGAAAAAGRWPSCRRCGRASEWLLLKLGACGERTAGTGGWGRAAPAGRMGTGRLPTMPRHARVNIPSGTRA